jgi:hypothetical protein
MPKFLTKIEKDKAQKEIDKLNLEIGKLRRKPYQIRESWQSGATIVFYIGSLIILAFNGAFDFKSRNLEIAKIALQKEKESLVEGNRILNAKRDSLNKSYLTEEKEFKVKISEINDSLQFLIKRQIYLNNINKGLTLSIGDSSKYIGKLLKDSDSLKNVIQLKNVRMNKMQGAILMNYSYFQMELQKCKDSLSKIPH